MRGSTIPVMLAFALTGCAGSSMLPTGWDYTGGPYAQDITAVLPGCGGPGRILAGTATGELFQSTDAGANWSFLSTVPGGGEVFQLLEDPESPGRLYAATASGGCVSADEGGHWMPLSITGKDSEAYPCRTIAIDPWKASVMFAGTGGRGIFKSTDGGKHWTAIVAGTDPTLASADVSDIKIDVTKPDVVYAALVPLGLVRSVDGGLTWTRLTPEVTATGTAVTHVLVNPKTREELLYGTSAGSIYKSTDGGASWVLSKRGDAYDRVHSLVTSASSPSLVVGGTEYGVVLSTDFGNSWQNVAGELSGTPLALSACATARGTSLYAFGEGVGLRSSADSGRTWSSIDRSLGGASIRLIRSDRGGTEILAGSRRIVFQYDGEAASWLPSGQGIRGLALNTFAIADDSSSVLYAATPAGVFKSTNSGKSWRLSMRKLGITPDFIDTHPTISTRMFASSEKGLFVSTDRGASWGQARPYRASFSIRSFTYMPTNAGIILGATSEGVIATTDGGFNWEQPRRGMGTPDIAVVTLSPDQAGTYFAWSTGGACFRSTNKGLEWQSRAVPWGSAKTFAIAMDRYVPSSVVAVVDGRHVYYSSSGGAAWQKVGEKTPALDITALHWNAGSACLYAGTRANGVYRIPLAELLRGLPDAAGPSE